MQRPGQRPPDLPGFYYDEAKRKYFRIQPDHAAPANAKYSRSRVQREHREAKKRRTAIQQDQLRARQTVRRPRVLGHPQSTGFGLTREIGPQEPTATLEARDVAFVAGLRPNRFHVEPPNPACRAGSLFDAVYTTKNDLIVAFNHTNGCSLYASHWSEPSAGAEQTIRLFNDDKKPVVAFLSPLIAIHTFDLLNLTSLAVLTREPKAPGNVFLDTLELENQAYFSPSRRLFMKLGTRESSLWDSDLHKDSKHIAVSGTDSLYILDPNRGALSQSLAVKSQSRGVSWLDFNTIAYGQGDENDRAHYGIALWDIRTNGTAMRFPRRKPATGIQTPDDSKLHLLVADNTRLSLYDTRMEKYPLLFFNHRHQGPQLQFDTYRDIVAALDADNLVQTYSVRSGQPIETLQRPPLSAQTGEDRDPSTDSLMTKLRWIYTDAESTAGKAPELQACQDRSIVRWSFGGKVDDES